MGVPTSEVGYTSATTGRGNHEVHDGHVVALEKQQQTNISEFIVSIHNNILTNSNKLCDVTFVVLTFE
jgi:hypothetical protein